MSQISPIIRSALFVRDLDQQKLFYQQALGFEQIYYEGELTASVAARIVGAPAQSGLECCIVRGDAPNVGMVGLFKLSPSPAALVKDPEKISLGESVMVFYCHALDKIVEKSVTLGAQILCPPVDFNMPHESQREAMIRDPEGFAINLVERDPERAWHRNKV